MNRDRIVVTICDEILSEKWKLDEELTDDKAMTQVHQAKAVNSSSNNLYWEEGVKDYHMPQLELSKRDLEFWMTKSWVSRQVKMQNVSYSTHSIQ